MNEHKLKLVDVACQVRLRTAKAIGIADGTVEKYKGQEREKIFWLPKSMVEENDDGTVTMPERLAKEKGLI